MDEKTQATFVVLLSLALEPLKLLMERGLLTPQECFQRLQQLRDLAQSRDELRPGAFLIEGAIRYLYSEGDPGPQTQPAPQATASPTEAELRLLNWVGEVMH